MCNKKTIMHNDFKHNWVYHYTVLSHFSLLPNAMTFNKRKAYAPTGLLFSVNM